MAVIITAAQTIVSVFDHFYIVAVDFIDICGVKVGGIMHTDKFVDADYFVYVAVDETEVMRNGQQSKFFL